MTISCIAGNETVSTLDIGSVGGALQTVQNVVQVRILTALTQVCHVCSVCGTPTWLDMLQLVDVSNVCLCMHGHVMPATVLIALRNVLYRCVCADRRASGQVASPPYR